MKEMNKHTYKLEVGILLIAFMVINFSFNAQGQTLEDVIVEEYYVSETATTYRIYLDMAEGDKLLSVFGYAGDEGILGNELKFETSTDFEQNFLGEDFGEDINSVLFLSFPELALDTYISVGACAINFAGVPENLDTDDTDILDFKSPDGFVQANVKTTRALGLSAINNEVFSDITATNGAYFIPGGASGFTDENVILIGQYTTNGVFQFRFNVQLQNGSNEQIYLHTNETLPDGSIGIVDERLKFSSNPSACFDPFPSIDESSLTTTQNANSFVTQWQPLPNQIGCQIAVRLAGGSLLGTRIVGGDAASSFSIPGSALQPGTDYEWRVRCGCSQAPLIASPFTTWQSFSTPEGAGLQVLSNTATDNSTVSFIVHDGGRANLEVFDITGKKLSSLFSGDSEPGLEYRFDFTVSHLPTGLYLYRLTTDEEIKTKKFILAR